MKLLDPILKYATPMFAVRWLQDELAARRVNVRLTRACIREFVLDADAAARLQAAAPTASPYSACLREEIALRADFLRDWTLSDDPVGTEGRYPRQLVKLACKYALPRPWKLSEPVASNCLHSRPTYLYWASSPQ
jgi:hypothetical protein